MYRKRNPYTAYLASISGRLPGALVELKNVDVVLPSTGTNAVWALGGGMTMNLLNGVEAGSGATQRIGRRVTWKSLTIRANFQIDAASTLQASVRFIVFVDKQCNAADCAPTDLLTADNVSAITNLANNHRFKILFDIVRSIGSIEDLTMNITKYRKLNVQTEFNTTSGGTVADMQTGAIWLGTYITGLATHLPDGSLYSRLRFSDQ